MTSTGQEQEQLYKCKVANCTYKYTKNYKGITNHYKNPRHHKVEELLDAGVSAWFYRNGREDDCRAMIDWLYTETYVALVVSEDEQDALFRSAWLLLLGILTVDVLLLALGTLTSDQKSASCVLRPAIKNSNMRKDALF